MAAATAEAKKAIGSLMKFEKTITTVATAIEKVAALLTVVGAG